MPSTPHLEPLSSKAIRVNLYFASRNVRGDREAFCLLYTKEKMAIINDLLLLKKMYHKAGVSIINREAFNHQVQVLS